MKKQTSQPEFPMGALTERLTDSCREQKHPWICQNCGGSDVPGYGNGLIRVVTDRYQEHDHNDKPEYRVVVLCGKCAKTIIAPHPRLYAKLAANAPFAGTMGICVSCQFRVGVTCSHPNAKANGGAGVHVRIKDPVRALVDGKDYRGPVELWPERARGCDEYIDSTPKKK